jgi:hypothetical protein
MTDLPASWYQSPQRTGILNALNDYWQEKLGDHALPSRADLDPMEFRYALGNVSLIDVLSDPLRFRFRMVASNIAARFDRGLTGTYVHDLPERENARLWDKVYRTVVRTGKPHTYVAGAVEGGVARLYRAVVWPLASNHRDIDMLLCCREPLDPVGEREPDTPGTWDGRVVGTGGLPVGS